MRGSIKYQANQIFLKLDGIGISKKDNRDNSNIKAENGNNVSDKIHSFKSKKDFINRVKEIGEFVKENFNIKDMQEINNTHIEKYIESKINKGLTYNTISTYLSQIYKLQLGLDRLDKKLDKHKNLFTRDKIKELRIKAKAETKNNEHTNRAYHSLDAVEKLINNRSIISFKLQKNYGLRISETTRILKKQLKGDNVLTITGKGGYTRDIVLKKELYNEISEHIKTKGLFKVSNRTYENDLKITIEKTNQEFNGSHGIRYSFAQLQKINGASDSEISYLLGHHREEITQHYLK